MQSFEHLHAVRSKKLRVEVFCTIDFALHHALLIAYFQGLLSSGSGVHSVLPSVSSIENFIPRTAFSTRFGKFKKRANIH